MRELHFELNNNNNNNTKRKRLFVVGVFLWVSTGFDKILNWRKMVTRKTEFILSYRNNFEIILLGSVKMHAANSFCYIRCIQLNNTYTHKQWQNIFYAKAVLFPACTECKHCAMCVGRLYALWKVVVDDVVSCMWKTGQTSRAVWRRFHFVFCFKIYDWKVFV